MGFVLVWFDLIVVCFLFLQTAIVEFALKHQINDLLPAFDN